MAQLKTDKNDKCQVWIPGHSVPVKCDVKYIFEPISWLENIFDVTLIINDHFYHFLIERIQKPALVRLSCSKKTVLEELR